MSRSIHQNKSRRYWRQHSSHDVEDWVAQAKKSQIKRLIRAERKIPELPFTPVDSQAISYSIEELHPSLFFPATIDDVKNVMDELPPGFLNGVSRIRFSAGREYINAQESVDGQVLDPVLQRKCIELEAGVYAPIVLGTYSRRHGAIQLFAYALDRSTVLSETTELALKMQMLITLIHELSHNHDMVQRVARGRWRMDNVAKAEAYADKLTRVLFESVAIPYARRVYGSSSR